MQILDAMRLSRRCPGRSFTGLGLATLLLLGGGCGDGKSSGGNGSIDNLPSPDGGSRADAAITTTADGGLVDGGAIKTATSARETVLFKMDSIQGVSRNPPVATTFTLAQPSYISRVFTYHYAETIGNKSPSVAFQDTTTGAVYGPWPQVGYKTFAGTLGASRDDPGNVVGPPDNYWMAYPGKSVPAGTYQVVDSDPATWCYTADQGNRGLTWVYGWSLATTAVTVATVAAKLAPAAGLAPADYEIHGTADDTVGAISADGTLTTNVDAARAGFLFATVKAGSLAASKLAPESGLYMTPAPGNSQLVRNGAVWSVAPAGSSVVDATTTVLSLLLLHPMAANLAPDVQTQQLQWMVATLNLGWATVTSAATAYDLALSAGTDPFDDPTFATALVASLNDVAANMPEYLSSLPGAVFKSGAVDNTPYNIAKAGIAVTSLGESARSATSVTLEPGSDTGTGLDYYFAVKELAASAMPQDLNSVAFVTPNMLQILPSSRDVATGFVASASYWKYLDLAGLVLQKATEALAGAAKLTPGSTVELPAKKFYEVRFFSGGFGYGNGVTEYQFAQTNFEAETGAAFKHNVATAVVEMLSLIPGSEAIFESETGSEVVAAVLLETTRALSQMLNDKGAAGIEANDVYNLMYNVCKTAVDTFVQKSTESAQKGTLKKVFSFFTSGAKKAVKLVMSVPGKLSKGGSLANRALRLARPNSIMEYYIVAVGYTPVTVTPPPVSTAYTMTYKLQNNPHPFTDIGCYDGCGDLSTPTTNATGALSLAGGTATLSSSYATTDDLGAPVACTVTGKGTWDSIAMLLDLTGSFSCTASTHLESGTFTSLSSWIDMGAGYLQTLSTPTWTAHFQAAGVGTSVCQASCNGDVAFKPTRLTP